MAKWLIWDETQRAGWNEWVALRPAEVQERIKKYNLSPDTLYRMKSTGQRVYIISVSDEDDTVRVNVEARFNYMLLPMIEECEVYGVNISDLEECDYPKEDEVTPGCWCPPDRGEPMDVEKVRAEQIAQAEKYPRGSEGYPCDLCDDKSKTT